MLPFIFLPFSSVSRVSPSPRSSSGRTPVKHLSTPSNKLSPLQLYSIIQSQERLLPSRPTPVNSQWVEFSSSVARMAGSHLAFGVPSSSPISSFGLRSTENCWRHFEQFVTSGPWWKHAHSLCSRTTFLWFLQWQRRPTPKPPGKFISCLSYLNLQPISDILKERPML